MGDFSRSDSHMYRHGTGYGQLNLFLAIRNVDVDAMRSFISMVSSVRDTGGYLSDFKNVGFDIGGLKYLPTSMGYSQPSPYSGVMGADVNMDCFIPEGSISDVQGSYQKSEIDSMRKTAAKNAAVIASLEEEILDLKEKLKAYEGKSQVKIIDTSDKVY